VKVSYWDALISVGVYYRLYYYLVGAVYDASEFQLWYTQPAGSIIRLAGGPLMFVVWLIHEYSYRTTDGGQPSGAW